MNLKEELGGWYNYLTLEDITNLEFTLETIRKIKGNKNFYPKPSNVFKALKLVQPKEVKVVILGMDPYPQKDVADGLAFSTQLEARPPSLTNIFKEIYKDLELKEKGILPKDYFHGNDLWWWARQGVLLLNTSLTVEEGKPGSHKKLWEPFISKVVDIIRVQNRPLVFLLWGNDAHTMYKETMFNNEVGNDCKFEIFMAAHPAVESYKENAGFFGCKHFSKTNDFLRKNNIREIDWQVYYKDDIPF